MRKLVLLVIAALALPACAQVFNMEHDRSQMAPLDGPMRFHTGRSRFGGLIHESATLTA